MPAFFKVFTLSLIGLITLPACTSWAGPYPVDDFRGQELEITDPETGESKEAKATKQFNVTMEAALPEGFPAPGPVGKVIIKEYPVARRAVVDREAGRNFNKLFNHIKKNNVAMTTPVTMELEKNETTGKHQMHNMAFYYEAPKQGKTGVDGQVIVEDLPPMKVISIGMAGGMSKESLAYARDQLNAYLKKHNLKAAGDMRVLGYNSPFVPFWKKYYEMQIPIEMKPMAAPATQPASSE